MAEKHKNIILYVIIVLLAIAIAALLFYMIPGRYRLNTEVTYEAETEYVANPSVGFAANAENVDMCEENSMVFIELTWAQWEPSEGQYDTEFLAENFHIDKWKEAGKHAVLRFVCDIPGDEQHMDIPQWLYDQTADGTFYSCEEGQGYCPNYENSVFITKHAVAVKALADYFNKDDFLSFTELGSIGNWGEWHAEDNDGNSLMPSEQTCWEYVNAYTDSFVYAKMLMRRSYIFAKDNGLGLYNDVLGEEDSTKTFLNWTTNGGSQETVDGTIEIVPMESFWNNGPSGGEITSSADPDLLFTDGLLDLIEQADKSHLSFIGPNIPDAETYSNARDALLRHMGYKIYIDKLKTTFNFKDSTIEVQLTWNNCGQAPAYWDYPVTLCVYDGDGNMVYWDNVDIKMTDLKPGTEIVTENAVPYDSVQNAFSIGVKVTDPDGNENITLANEDIEWNEDVQMLYSYERSE